MHLFPQNPRCHLLVKTPTLHLFYKKRLFPGLMTLGILCSDHVVSTRLVKILQRNANHTGAWLPQTALQRAPQEKPINQPQMRSRVLPRVPRQSSVSLLLHSLLIFQAWRAGAAIAHFFFFFIFFFFLLTHN